MSSKKVKEEIIDCPRAKFSRAFFSYNWDNTERHFIISFMNLEDDCPRELKFFKYKFLDEQLNDPHGQAVIACTLGIKDEDLDHFMKLLNDIYECSEIEMGDENASYINYMFPYVQGWLYKLKLGVKQYKGKKYYSVKSAERS